MSTKNLIFYISGLELSLVDIIKEIDERLKKDGFVGKFLLTSMSISAGLPKNDYGQTIHITYREKPEAYDNFPHRDAKKEVLFDF